LLYLDEVLFRIAGTIVLTNWQFASSIKRVQRIVNRHRIWIAGIMACRINPATYRRIKTSQLE
jgi:hypothetical protein